VPIAAAASLLLLESRSSSSRRVMLTSPRDALIAVNQDGHSGVAAAVLKDRARCIPQYVPNAARKPKCLSNRVTAGLSIVAIATVNPELIVNK
jgi:hypothetical protein